MQHADDHVPMTDWQRCYVCNQALSAAIAKVADMELGPREAGVLIEAIKREAEKAVAHGAAS